jgi:hypothetical protein
LCRIVPPVTEWAEADGREHFAGVGKAGPSNDLLKHLGPLSEHLGPADFVTAATAMEWRTTPLTCRSEHPERVKHLNK